MEAIETGGPPGLVRRDVAFFIWFVDANLWFPWDLTALEVGLSGKDKFGDVNGYQGEGHQVHGIQKPLSH